MSTQAQDTFIHLIKDMESELTHIGFSHLSTTKKGYATYVDYKSAENIHASFMFGPSDWHVELVLRKDEKNYELKDLLQIPSIAEWIRNSKFKEQTSNRIKDEITFFVGLLRFVINTQTLTN